VRALDLIGGAEVMSDKDCWELLASEEVGRVAEVIDGRVEIFPVNYALDGDGIIFRTNAGRKLSGVLSGEVAFEVDCIDKDARVGWSVVVHGEAHDISRFDTSGRQSAVQAWSGQKDYLVRIRPISMTGRRVSPPG